MATNLHSLPQPLVEALTPERRRPIPGRFGVTTLIDAPLRRILTMRHFDEITEDVSENIWALLGKMGHAVLEQNKEVSEIRFEKDLFGAKIVGVVDYSNDGVVIDFKFTSVWAAIFASEKSEWDQQLQIYGYLVQLSGKPVSSLENWLILRDWNVRERQRSSGDYPEIPFKQIVYKPWPREAVEAFIQERVSLHLNAEKSRPDQASNEIPTHLWCNREERWERPTKWAVKKKNQERAVRVYDTKEQAEAHFDVWPEMGFHIEERRGESVRCASYCSLVNWCPCYASLKEAI
uniref:PD-(D/E)XK nuclease superfamily protein n=1 Tax=viral metagenome TaxID=1070528 RepID=A0A6M3JIV4_9ZZZZ